MAHDPQANEPRGGGERVRIRDLGQIRIPVRDLDRAVAFSRDTLGLPHLFSAPPALAFFDCGGVRLFLDAPQGGEPGRPGSIPYLRVDDIASGHRALMSEMPRRA